MAKIAQDRSRKPQRIKMIAQTGQESSKRASRFPIRPSPWSLVPVPVPGPGPWSRSLVPDPWSLVPVPGPWSLVPVPGP
eukprot:4209142-Karenia_brevis.AAC.1